MLCHCIFWVRVHRGKCFPTSFLQFCDQVRHLLMRCVWQEKMKGGISHDLDRFVSVTKTDKGDIVQTDLVSMMMSIHNTVLSIFLLTAWYENLEYE